MNCYEHGRKLDDAVLFASPEEASAAWEKYSKHLNTGHYLDVVVPVGDKFAVKVCTGCGYLGKIQSA